MRIQFHPKTRLTSITGAIERPSQPYKLDLAPPQLRREQQLLPGRHCIAKLRLGPDSQATALYTHYGDALLQIFEHLVLIVAVDTGETAAGDSADQKI
jgi:hypothetical protein